LLTASWSPISHAPLHADCAELVRRLGRRRFPADTLRGRRQEVSALIPIDLWPSSLDRRRCRCASASNGKALPWRISCRRTGRRPAAATNCTNCFVTRSGASGVAVLAGDYQSMVSGRRRAAGRRGMRRECAVTGPQLGFGQDEIAPHAEHSASAEHGPIRAGAGSSARSPR
jgi:hypothetical protein